MGIGHKVILLMESYSIQQLKQILMKLGFIYEYRIGRK